MSNVLRLAIVDPDDGTRESLKSMLLGMDIVWLEAECSRYEFFADVVAQTTPNVGIVVVDKDHDKAIDLITNLRETSPECAVLVISSSDSGELILRAMRAGAREFLTQPVQVQDLIGALDRIGIHFGASGQGRSRACTVVAVAGATGGVGTTSLAVNLGCALAADEANSVALLDLDLALGDADVFLDTIPEYTLIDVAQNVSRLDFSLLKRSLTKHSSGLYLLPRPVQLQDTPLVNAEDFQRVIGLLKATFSHLIIDLSKGYTHLDLSTMEQADMVLLVTQLDLPCLRNVVRLMMSFGEMDGLKDKVKVVVNRAGLGAGQISLKKATETIGGEIFWQIPNDYRVMVEVRNNGVPLIEQAPKAALTQAIQGLAAAINGQDTSQDVAKGASGKWFGLFAGRDKQKGDAAAK